MSIITSPSVPSSPVQRMITKPKKELNVVILFLQCIGIFAVVLGHGGGTIPVLTNLPFPYYSWHMPFFIFLSGYLFDRTSGFRKYAVKKIKRHLLPALMINAICGVFSQCLRDLDLTSYGRPITFKALFLTPFTTGYQFFINVSLWFIFQLFILELMFSAFDNLTSRKADSPMLLITTLLSLASCWIASNRATILSNQFIMLLVRTAFLSFFFWLGVYFKAHWEQRFKQFLNLKISIAIMLMQALFLLLSNMTITFNTRNMDFSKLAFSYSPIVTSITSLLFFLGIAYSIAPYLENSRLLYTIGCNTKYIVYFHQLCFVLISLSLVCVAQRFHPEFLNSFKVKDAISNQYYTWNGNKYAQLIYVFLGTFLPLFICVPIQKIQSIWMRTLIYGIIVIVIVAYLLILSKII